jgi:hypothetical protein
MSNIAFSVINISRCTPHAYRSTTVQIRFRISDDSVQRSRWSVSIDTHVRDHMALRCSTSGGSCRLICNYGSLDCSSILRTRLRAKKNTGEQIRKIKNIQSIRNTGLKPPRNTNAVRTTTIVAVKEVQPVSKRASRALTTPPISRSKSRSIPAK